MSEHFWKSVLAAKTFNTPAGRILQAEAKKKLSPLDAKLATEMVTAICAFYRREGQYEFWPAMRKQRDEHIPAILADFKKAEEVEARFLVNAHALAGPDGFRHAGELLAMLTRNSHLPGALKSLPKKWEALNIAKLAPAAEKTLAAQKGSPSSIIPFWSLLYVVLRVMPDAKVVGLIEKAAPKWSSMPVFDNVKAAALGDSAKA